MSARRAQDATRAKGIKMILSSKKWNEEPKWLTTPGPLPVNASRARTYDITCNTDGLRSEISLRLFLCARNRILYMEQPGVKHTEVAGKISNLKALDRTDVAKAVYAWRANRWMDSCHGYVDACTHRHTRVHMTCDAFNLTFIFAVCDYGNGDNSSLDYCTIFSEGND